MKILLIEDDGIVEFVKMELEHEGYAVQAARKSFRCTAGKYGRKMALTVG